MLDPRRAAVDTLAGELAEQGLAWRGAFHPEPDNKVPPFAGGAPALMVCLFRWTGGEQWPVFARSPEANDGFPDPLNRWSKRLRDAAAEGLNAAAFYPFGGPPWLDFHRWALKAEPVHRSPLGLLIQRWSLALVSRGARPTPAPGTCSPREHGPSLRGVPRTAVPFGLPDLRFRSGPPLRHVACGQSGRVCPSQRIEEAQAVVSQLLYSQPWLTIARFKASATRYPPEIQARYVAGLRRAGMPEE
jgi:hypothetical protein